MLKKLLKFKDGKELDVKYPIRLFDSKDNIIYHENSNGYRYKREYDSNNNEIYCEYSNGYWIKRKYDSNNNEIYCEDSNGLIMDKRPKPTIESLLERIEELEKKVSKG